jgi:hypothetical protein
MGVRTWLNNYRSEISLLVPNAKLSRPDQASELWWKRFFTDRKSEQNRHVAARGWLQRLVRLIGQECHQ